MAAFQVKGHSLAVLELLAGGLTNKEIAARMRLSEATVKWHVSRLLVFYGAANRAGLASEAIQRGDLRTYTRASGAVEEL